MGLLDNIRETNGTRLFFNEKELKIEHGVLTLKCDVRVDLHAYNHEIKHKNHLDEIKPST